MQKRKRGRVMNKKIKVIVDDVELEVLVSEEDLAKLTEKKKKRTGYERVSNDETYYYAEDGEVGDLIECDDDSDARIYNAANYYSDQTLAENNARADKLMRQLRRFAAENCEEFPWGVVNKKYYIYYDYIYKEIRTGYIYRQKTFSTIYFDTEENAEKAIDTFKDELMWYFTEYRDRV
jgi:hypothetical protein